MRDVILKRLIKNGILNILFYFIVFGLCFVILYPIFFMISCSFRTPQDMNDPTVLWIPRHFTFDTIIQTAKAMDLKHTLFNTFTVNMVCAVMQTIVCAFTGYGFARYNFRLKKFFLIILMLTAIVPQQIILISQYSNLRYFGIKGIFEINLINTPFAMYLPAIMGSGIYSGLMIMIFIIFFRKLPSELEDASAIDGCGTFRTFIEIIIPNSVTPIAVVFIFSAVFYWNDYYVTSALYNDNRTVTIMLNNLDSWLNYSVFGNTTSQQSTRDIIVWLEAGCLLSISPLLIIYIFLNKYIRQGIEYAGISG